MSNLADFHSPFNNQYLLILQEAQCKFDVVYYHFLYFFVLFVVYIEISP